MKWLFGILFLMTHLANALAQNYELAPGSISFAKKAYTDQGELNMGYFVTCNDSAIGYCQDMCAASTCLVSTDSCDSCITSRNLNVFALFKDFSKLFALSSGPLDGSVLKKLKSNDVRIVDENAILNLFDDTQNDEKYEMAKLNFQSSCPSETTKAFLIIDSELVPVVYICQGRYGQIVYHARWSSELSQ